MGSLNCSLMTPLPSQTVGPVTKIMIGCSYICLGDHAVQPEGVAHLRRAVGSEVSGDQKENSFKVALEDIDRSS